MSWERTSSTLSLDNCSMMVVRGEHSKGLVRYTPGERKGEREREVNDDKEKERRRQKLIERKTRRRKEGRKEEEKTAKEETAKKNKK